MAKGNHCNILKGNNIKTNNELISMTFKKKKEKSLPKIRVKRKLNKAIVKKNSINYEDDEYS